MIRTLSLIISGFGIGFMVYGAYALAVAAGQPIDVNYTHHGYEVTWSPYLFPGVGSMLIGVILCLAGIVFVLTTMPTRKYFKEVNGG